MRTRLCHDEKSSPKPKAKKEIASRKHEPIAPLEDAAAALDAPLDERMWPPINSRWQAREDEASSTGHRVEPIEEDDEHNAEKLIEQGLHGYVPRLPESHASRAVDTIARCIFQIRHPELVEGSVQPAFSLQRQN